MSLTRSSRLAEAFKVVQEILKRYIENEDEWVDTLAESAKGSIIYSWTEKEETVEDLVGQTVKAYMRGTDSKYNRQFVRALGRVELSDIKAIAKRILPEFLSENSTRTVIVCNPSSIENIVQDFSELGIQLNNYQKLEDTFLVDGITTDFV